MIALLATLIVSISATAQINAANLAVATGNTATFRIATIGVSNVQNNNPPVGNSASAPTPVPFPFSTGQINVVIRPQPQDNVILKTLASTSSGDSVGPYQDFAAYSATGSAPGFVVCFNSTSFPFNNTNLNGPFEACSSTLFPNNGGTPGQLQRYTVALVQTTNAASPSLACLAGNGAGGAGPQCAQGLPGSVTFAVETTTETLSARQCESGPVFARGNALSCGQTIVDGTPIMAAGITESTIVTNPVLNPLPFSATQLTPPISVFPRSGSTYNVQTGISGTVVGPINGQARSWEVLINTPTPASVTPSFSIFIAFVNAAHRESQPPTPTAAPLVDSSVVVMVTDSSTSPFLAGGNAVDNVYHYAYVSQASPIQFIEFPLNGQSYTISTATGVQLNSSLSVTVNPPFFNGTLLGDVNAKASSTLAGLGPGALTIANNHYYIVAITANGDRYQLSGFDVTPSSALQGFESQVISLITTSSSFINSPTPGLPSTGGVNLPALQLVSTPSSTFDDDGFLGSFACSPVYNIASPTAPVVATTRNLATVVQPDGGPAVTGSFLLSSSGNCQNPFPVTTNPINVGTSSCGREVTLIVGRPYVLISQVQDPNLNMANCVANVSSTLLGDLAFTGNIHNSPVTSGFSLSVTISTCSCGGGGGSPTPPACVPYTVPSCIAHADDAVAAVVLGANGVAKETTVIKNGVGYLGKLLRAVHKKVKKL